MSNLSRYVRVEANTGVLNRLQAELVQLDRARTFYDGLFWRFLPAADPSVDRFLIQDIDSVVNVKERISVDQWLASDKYFHVMRDYWNHTELILAGMWGGVGGLLPPLVWLLESFEIKTLPTKTIAQI